MSRSNRRIVRRGAPLAVMALGIAVFWHAAADAAPTPVGLGAATSFGVLAGAGITNTGPTTIVGDAGSFPTTSQTGFNGPAPDAVTFAGGGVDHGGDAVTKAAKRDLLTAYLDAAGRLPELAHAVELGGDTLTPGVYSNGTFEVTGTLTLDFQNDLTASFIFKTATTLVTGAGSSIVLVNADADAACRITWKVGSSATFGTATQFQGDVLVRADITANTGATFLGRLLASDGAVTLDTNTIDRGSCVTLAAGTTTTTTDGGGSGGPTPTTTAASTTTTAAAAVTSTTAATPTPTSAPTVTPTTVASATSSGVPGPTPRIVVSSGAPEPRAPSSPTAPVAPPIRRTTGAPELPRTGLDASTLTMVGVGLVVAGAAAVAVERRRGAAGARVVRVAARV